MTAQVRQRVGWIDALRGVAIMLMVLDHVLVQAAATSPLRYTVTRVSLPLFMVCAGAVWREGMSRRRVWAAAIVEWPLVLALGMPVPGILAVYLLAEAMVRGWPWMLGRPLTYGSLWLLAAIYVPNGWTGYHPGLVLGWFLIGRMAAWELQRWALALPQWCEAVGRRPLEWYVGHLLVLVALTQGGVL